MTKGKMDEFYARMLKGILLSTDVQLREEKGEIPAYRESEQAIGSLLGKYRLHFSAELTTRAVKMTYVYTLFFCFENSVRDLVAQRLADRVGAKWWDSVPQNVRKRVDDKRKEMENNKWHQAVISENIDLTLFGDLANIIINSWHHFEDLFPAQHWVKQRLEELERSRNVIAHGNLLPDAEIERIEQYLDDWLRQVP